MDSFDSLSLNDILPRQKLHRSMSFSEISPRKEITIAQKIISGQSGNTVLRQYSYHELGVVPGTSLKYSQKFVSELHIDLSGSNSYPDILSVQKSPGNLESGFKKIQFNSDSKNNKTLPINKEGEQRLKRSHVPSDSDEDMKRKKIFRVTPLLHKTKNEKMVFERGVVSDDEKVHSKTITQLLFVIIPVVFAVLATFCTHYSLVQNVCYEKLNISSSEYSLNSNLFGQKEAAKNIVDTLREFNSSEQKIGLQVMVFTGATGVGKTYTASLLEEAFPWKQNIHNFIMPIAFETLSEHLIQKYPYCGDHLVIVDDLRAEDVKDVNLIVSHLKHFAEQNRVIAVLIFKFHKQLSGERSENYVLQKSEELQRDLLQRDVNSVMINFKSLDKSDVIMCIKEALRRHWIHVSEEAINTVLDQVDYHSEGCKRISSKIAVVNELWVREKEDI